MMTYEIFHSTGKDIELGDFVRLVNKEARDGVAMGEIAGILHREFRKVSQITNEHLYLETPYQGEIIPLNYVRNRSSQGNRYHWEVRRELLEINYKEDQPEVDDEDL